MAKVQNLALLFANTWLATSVPAKRANIIIVAEKPLTNPRFACTLRIPANS